MPKRPENIRIYAKFGWLTSCLQGKVFLVNLSLENPIMMLPLKNSVVWHITKWEKCHEVLDFGDGRQETDI